MWMEFETDPHVILLSSSEFLDNRHSKTCILLKDIQQIFAHILYIDCNKIQNRGMSVKLHRSIVILVKTGAVKAKIYLEA